MLCDIINNHLQGKFLGGILKNRKILTLIITLQEAFTAVLPYILLTYITALFYSITNYLDIRNMLISKDEFQILNKMFTTLFPVVMSMSIAYFYSLRTKVSQIMSVILSVSIYITVVVIKTSPNFSPPSGMTPSALLMPFVGVYLLKVLYPVLSLRIDKQDGNFHVYRLLNYMFAFIAAYLASIAVYIAFYSLYGICIGKIVSIDLNLPVIISLAIRDFFVQVLWFFGIHGSHIMYSILGNSHFNEFLAPNLKYIEFHRMFVNIGGDGLGLPMALALLFALRDKNLKTIVKISLPFTFVNIDTLLIYAVIVFNRYFLIPFILLPVINLLSAYLVLQYIPVHFTDYNLVWTTPPLVDTYLKTDGNIYVMALQFFLILADTAIYYYFAKKYDSANSVISAKELLENSLELKDELKSNESLLAFKAQKELISAQAKLEEIINSLNNENLRIYYQPKIDIKNMTCNKFEALIRYTQNGKTTGPVFLPIIEQAGLASVIDLWVCQEVKKHLIEWKKDNFTPDISINLHPDTIASKSAVEKIISILKFENVTFEIIERSFLYGDVAMQNIQRLIEHNFKISIDDFGSGYSNLETITHIRIHELKLDKTLIDIIDTQKGYSVCKHTVEICHDLDILVTAEGVETKEQYRLAKEIEVDLIQGFYFSGAISFEKVKEFKVNSALF